MAPVKDFLTAELQKKNAADLTPKNEDVICDELKNGVNDYVLTSGCVRQVHFMDIDFN